MDEAKRLKKLESKIYYDLNRERVRKKNSEMSKERAARLKQLNKWLLRGGLNVNDQEEFEAYCENTYGYRSAFLCMLTGFELKKSWQACAEQKNAIIEQQAKELQALRGFAKTVIEGGFQNGNAFVFGLIDEESNQTKLLTGE